MDGDMDAEWGDPDPFEEDALADGLRTPPSPAGSPQRAPLEPAGARGRIRPSPSGR